MLYQQYPNQDKLYRDKMRKDEMKIEKIKHNKKQDEIKVM